MDKQYNVDKISEVNKNQNNEQLRSAFKKSSKSRKYQNLSVRFIEEKEKNNDEKAESLNSVYFSNRLAF